MAKIIFRRGVHVGKIYQNYVSVGKETSKKGNHLLPKFTWLHKHGVEVNWGLMWVIKQDIGLIE